MPSAAALLPVWGVFVVSAESEIKLLGIIFAPNKHVCLVNKLLQIRSNSEIYYQATKQTVHHSALPFSLNCKFSFFFFFKDNMLCQYFSNSYSIMEKERKAL